MRIRSVAAALLAFVSMAAPALAQEAPPAEPVTPVAEPQPPAAEAPPPVAEPPPPVAEPLPPPVAAPPPSPPAAEAPPPVAALPPARPPAPVQPFGFAPPGAAPSRSQITFAPAPAPDAGRDAPTAPVKEPSEFHLDLGFGTELPVSVGGVITAEVPHRILFQVGAGFMPHQYAYAIDGFLTSVGAYDQTISQLIRNALGNSFVLRASTGWRPFENHGFEILGGYTLMTLGGSTTAADVINAVLAEGGSSQRVTSGMNVDVPLSATLHSFHVSLGWRWLLADDRIVVRASLSYLQCVASNVGVSLANMGGQAMTSEASVNQALNAFLGPYFSTYAKAPTMGLSAAYRF